MQSSESYVRGACQCVAFYERRCFMFGMYKDSLCVDDDYGRNRKIEKIEVGFVGTESLALTL